MPENEPTTPTTEELLTPAEVARYLRVDTKTVTRWAQRGRLAAIRLPGGHRRYRRSAVEAILAGDQPTVDQ